MVEVAECLSILLARDESVEIKKNHYRLGLYDKNTAFLYVVVQLLLTTTYKRLEKEMMI